MRMYAPNANILERAYGGTVSREHPVSEPVPITRPVPGLRKAATYAEVKSNARTVYEHSVTYHATDRQSKQDIQRHGFKLDRKTQGAMEGGAAPDPESASFHYLSPSRERVKAFADFHLSGRSSAIVRVVGAGNAFPVETDPRSEAFQGYRTGSDIEPHLVLGSKHSRPGEDAEGFRQELSRAGMEVDRELAGRLLREVQSDSEDDMSGKVQPDPDDFYD